MKLLHFADAHIDMANYGRHDPETGLPVRVLDFLKSLDAIVDSAISEKVDMVIFAGDAYKDRSPAPTFQREWGRRIMRLSEAKIPTLLLIGNQSRPDIFALNIVRPAPLYDEVIEVSEQIDKEGNIISVNSSEENIKALIEENR